MLCEQEGRPLSRCTPGGANPEYSKNDPETPRLPVVSQDCDAVNRIQIPSLLFVARVPFASGVDLSWALLTHTLLHRQTPAPCRPPPCRVPLQRCCSPSSYARLLLLWRRIILQVNASCDMRTPAMVSSRPSPRAQPVESVCIV